MPQLFLPGMPDGAIKINSIVSLLNKDNQVTWFVGTDLFFTHRRDNKRSFQLALALLMENGHARPCEIEQTLGVAHRTIMRLRKKLATQGAEAFFRPAATRGPAVLTEEVRTQCEELLSTGHTIAKTARKVGINPSTLSKAISSGRVTKPESALPLTIPQSRSKSLSDSTHPEPSTKSERSRQDAQAAQRIGTACTRSTERTAAAMGLIDHTPTYFEPATDVALGGVLCALPALCANGLLSGLERHLSLPKGYYSALHILTILAFMALARIRRPEQLRHHPPGELGKVVGLDRVPEVRTLRKKIAYLADEGNPIQWMRELSVQWMQADPEEAGYLYIDGHVRVYHGSKARLPRRYVSRQKLCLRGTTDYWINDALGRPFFVVSQAVTEGLSAVLLEEIVPELLTAVPNQPTEQQLADDPLLHRFVVIFDREGSHHHLFSELWKQRIGAISYRKSVRDKWPESEFIKTKVTHPNGEITEMLLASKESEITKKNATPVPVIEVRRLSDNGHQTTLITSARQMKIPEIAAQMFSRWCQENYFGYMMQHYDIDGLVEYGCEELPGTLRVINPAWRNLDTQVRRQRTKLNRAQAKLGAMPPPDPDDAKNIRQRSELYADIETLSTDYEALKAQRRMHKRKVALSDLPEEDRPTQLLPLAKTLTDTVKMIAYRAETALVGLLQRHIKTAAETRALIRELFVTDVDLLPDRENDTLIIRVHRMASPVHDRAIAGLLNDLNEVKFKHPETGQLLHYELV